MPKQKTVPAVKAMKTFSIKIDPQLMKRAVSLDVHTANIMRQALEKEVAAMTALVEGKCHYCGQHTTQKKEAKKKYPRHKVRA